MMCIPAIDRLALSLASRPVHADGGSLGEDLRRPVHAESMQVAQRKVAELAGDLSSTQEQLHIAESSVTSISTEVQELRRDLQASTTRHHQQLLFVKV